MSSVMTQAHPSVTSVKIGDLKEFDALSVSIGISTPSDDARIGLGAIPIYRIEVVVDAHDTDNLPFDSLQHLFDMAMKTSADQIEEIKLNFWKDESHTDVVCVGSFTGWVSNLHFQSGTGNHTLVMNLNIFWGNDTAPLLTISN